MSARRDWRARPVSANARQYSWERCDRSGVDAPIHSEAGSVGGCAHVTPTATFAEALEHFEHAERIEPGFYPKNLLLTAQALSRLGRADEAKAALAKCLAATPKSPEDEATLEEARKLKL